MDGLGGLMGMVEVARRGCGTGCGLPSVVSSPAAGLSTDCRQIFIVVIKDPSPHALTQIMV